MDFWPWVYSPGPRHRVEFSGQNSDTHSDTLRSESKGDWILGIPTYKVKSKFKVEESPKFGVLSGLENFYHK